MTILSRPGARVRRQRSFRPSLGSEPPTLEARTSPTPVMIFLFDTPYGFFNGSSDTIFTPRGSDQGATGYSSNSISMSTGYSIISQMGRTVIQGLPGYWSSSGWTPPTDYVAATGGGRMSASFIGPARGSTTVGTQGIQLLVSHQHQETVDVLMPGTYTLPFENKVQTSFSTSPDLKFDLVSTDGGPIFGTIEYSFSLTLDAPTGGFTNHAQVYVVSDQFRAYLGPNPVTSGGVVIQGLTSGGWTTLYSNAAFTSGTASATFSAPMIPQMTVSAGSHLSDVYPVSVSSDVGNNGYLAFAFHATLT
jgi:hypothetical protein